MEGLGAAPGNAEPAGLALIRSDFEQVLVWVVEVQRWCSASRTRFFSRFCIRSYGIECRAMRDTCSPDSSEYGLELCSRNRKRVVLKPRCAPRGQLKLEVRTGSNDRKRPVR